MEPVKDKAAKSGDAEVLDFDAALLANCAPPSRADLIAEAAMRQLAARPAA